MGVYLELKFFYRFYTYTYYYLSTHFRSDSKYSSVLEEIIKIDLVNT